MVGINLLPFRLARANCEVQRTLPVLTLLSDLEWVATGSLSVNGILMGSKYSSVEWRIGRHHGKRIGKRKLAASGILTGSISRRAASRQDQAMWKRRHVADQNPMGNWSMSGHGPYPDGCRLRAVACAATAMELRMLSWTYSVPEGLGKLLRDYPFRPGTPGQVASLVRVRASVPVRGHRGHPAAHFCVLEGHDAAERSSRWTLTGPAPARPGRASRASTTSWEVASPQGTCSCSKEVPAPARPRSRSASCWKARPRASVGST